MQEILEQLTDEQIRQLVMDEIKKSPEDTVWLYTLIGMGRMAIETNAASASISTEATINDQRWKLSMKVTYKRVKQKKVLPGG